MPRIIDPFAGTQVGGGGGYPRQSVVNTAPMAIGQGVETAAAAIAQAMQGMGQNKVELARDKFRGELEQALLAQRSEAEERLQASRIEGERGMQKDRLDAEKMATVFAKLLDMKSALVLHQAERADKLDDEERQIYRDRAQQISGGAIQLMKDAAASSSEEKKKALNKLAGDFETAQAVRQEILGMPELSTSENFRNWVDRNYVTNYPLVPGVNIYTSTGSSPDPVNKLADLIAAKASRIGDPRLRAAAINEGINRLKDYSADSEFESRFSNPGLITESKLPSRLREQIDAAAKARGVEDPSKRFDWSKEALDLANGTLAPDLAGKINKQVDAQLKDSQERYNRVVVDPTYKDLLTGIQSARKANPEAADLDVMGLINKYMSGKLGTSDAPATNAPAVAAPSAPPPAPTSAPSDFSQFEQMAPYMGLPSQSSAAEQDPMSAIAMLLGSSSGGRFS